LLCTNYEEAVDIFSRYSDNIIGVITDAGFPKEGVHDDQVRDRTHCHKQLARLETLRPATHNP
jgi:hypothetical protein